MIRAFWHCHTVSKLSTLTQCALVPADALNDRWTVSSDALNDQWLEVKYLDKDHKKLLFL